jgi:biopolymer transport protein ExbD
MLSMAVHRSLPVSLPVSSAAEVHTEMNLTLTINSRGEIFLDNTNVSREELQALLLQKTLKTTAGKSVQVDLFADKALSYQELYLVLDIIRSAGISNVSLQSGTIK